MTEPTGYHADIYSLEGPTLERALRANLMEQANGPSRGYELLTAERVEFWPAVVSIVAGQQVYDLPRGETVEGVRAGQLFLVRYNANNQRAIFLVGPRIDQP